MINSVEPVPLAQDHFVETYPIQIKFTITNTGQIDLNGKAYYGGSSGFARILIETSGPVSINGLRPNDSIQSR